MPLATECVSSKPNPAGTSGSVRSSRRFCPGNSRCGVRITHVPSCPGRAALARRFVDEHLVGVVGAIAIGVLVDGDAAAAGCVVWGGGLAVVFGAVILVVTNLAQPGRIGTGRSAIPRAVRVHQAQVRRLRNQRLCSTVNDESLGQFNFFRLGWAEPFPVDEFLPQQHAAGL